jgi:hypothetical protein
LFLTLPPLFGCLRESAHRHKVSQKQDSILKILFLDFIDLIRHQLSDLMKPVFAFENTATKNCVSSLKRLKVSGENQLNMLPSLHLKSNRHGA